MVESNLGKRSVTCARLFVSLVTCRTVNDVGLCTKTEM